MEKGRFFGANNYEIFNRLQFTKVLVQQFRMSQAWHAVYCPPKFLHAQTIQRMPPHEMKTTVWWGAQQLRWSVICLEKKKGRNDYSVEQDYWSRLCMKIIQTQTFSPAPMIRPFYQELIQFAVKLLPFVLNTKRLPVYLRP